MDTSPSHIKSLVETAIKTLSNADWNPSQGGTWQAKDADVTVEFNKPTRFCNKASYRVTGKEIGVWVGYLSGTSHKTIGKPNQNYTPERLAREVELKDRPLEDIVSDGLRL